MTKHQNDIRLKLEASLVECDDKIANIRYEIKECDYDCNKVEELKESLYDECDTYRMIVSRLNGKYYMNF